MVKRLGGDARLDYINKMIVNSSIESMKKHSKKKEFFGSGLTSSEAAAISDELRAELMATCEVALGKVGYSNIEL